MRRSRVVGALAAAAAVLLGVVLVRGDSAVDPDVLAQARAAAAGEPSPAASAAAEADTVLLQANGLPGLRLGAAPRGLQVHTDPFGPSGAAGGCDMATPAFVEQLPQEGGTVDPLDRLAERYNVMGWVVDGTVQSVQLLSWAGEAETSEVLRSWVGVTLGSPVQVASELPGAVTRTEAVWPGERPVTVVRVPLQGGGTELVVSDAVDPLLGTAVDTGAAAGRVTTVELRTRAGQRCTREWAEAVAALHAGDGDRVAVSADGRVLGVRPGDPVAAAVEAGVLVDSGDDGAPGCAWYRDRRDRVRVVADEGVVTRVELVGQGFEVEDGFRSGDTVQDLLDGPMGELVSARELFSATGERPGDVTAVTEGSVYVHLPEAVLELSVGPSVRPVPGVMALVTGGEPRVRWLGVRAPADHDLDPWAC